ncbi:precorrin-3B C(17)-methyltransferase [Streptomyces sp. NPDC056361]|uniref:precorrin-3B C(17)-methyltransferase n=1 Tax=Streptomyces sp. NPDC056361 TaxID=3345795 RepID=UPI0035D79EB3
MRRHRSRKTVVGSLVFVTLAVLAGGYAVAVGGEPRDTMRYCPSPEEPRLPPGTPCISQDPNDRYRENHAFQQEMEITDEQRAGAQGKAEALAKALRALSGGRPEGKPEGEPKEMPTGEPTGEPIGEPTGEGAGEAEVRAAAAAALGLAPDRIEYRAEARPGLLVGGGHGKVCVIGRIDRRGVATAEVTGRTLDGTCIPGLGGH